MKKCTKCGIETNNFCIRKGSSDGYASWCRLCNNNRLKEYKKTKNGLSSSLYSGQRQRSIRRGDTYPPYTLREFRIWLYSQNIFHKLFSDWKESNFSSKLSPSINRIDDYKPYTFDNIEIVTWGFNLSKSHKDRKNGVNNKFSKGVVGIHNKTSKEVKFYSMMEASRVTGIPNSNISQCCSGIYKSAGGYTWSYLKSMD